MTDSADDLDALFEEMANQRVDVPATVASVEAPKAETPKPTTEAMSALKLNLSLTDSSGKPMFDRLGGLVRMMHDSMRELV